MSSDPKKWVHFLCEWEGVRWCYSEKFTIFRAICVTIRWNWSLGAGASFVMDKTKKFGFFEPPFGAESREILGGCDAFCANSTVKILPFFARFPWFFLEIDSCVQGQLSGCSLFKWICPWYRKVVTNVIKINISHLGNILAGFQGKKGTQSQPSTTSVRLFTGQVWRMR